jgi:DNA-binding MarR family transcriptional regulator
MQGVQPEPPPDPGTPTTASVRPVQPLDFVQNPDELAWLTEVEQRAWLGFLHSNRAVFAALESQLHSEAGMPLAYYSILVRLSEAPERTLRMGELASQLFASPSSISHAGTRLEALGWVRRQNDPVDRRAQFAVLTDAGAEALAAAAPGHIAAVRRRLIDRLSPEQLGQLIAISQAILTEPTAG